MITPPYPPPSGMFGPPPQSRAAALAMRVLWTVIPILTLGLAGWVPSLVFAIRRRTLRSAIWCAVFVAGLAGFITLLIVVPSDSEAGGSGAPQAAAGAYTVVYIFGAALHAWFGSKGLDLVRSRLDVMPAMYGYPNPQYDLPPHYGQPTYQGRQLSYGQQPQYPQPPQLGQQPPAYGSQTTWTGPGTQPQPQPPEPQYRPQQQPYAPLDTTAAEAAEVQAELRELRGLLDEGKA